MEKKKRKVDGCFAEVGGRSGGRFKMKVVRVGLFQTVRFTET